MDSPAASLSRIDSAVILVPAITGFPIITFGSDRISFVSTISPSVFLRPMRLSLRNFPVEARAAHSSPDTEVAKGAQGVCLIKVPCRKGAAANKFVTTLTGESIMLSNPCGWTIHVSNVGRGNRRLSLPESFVF